MSNLGSAAARGWGGNNDLTNGAWLDKWCPGLNRVSDIDSEPGHHVLHNLHAFPHKEATIEYKRIGQQLGKGQMLQLCDRVGLWVRDEDGTTIRRRVFIVYYNKMALAAPPVELLRDGRTLPLRCSTPDELAWLICKFVWPNLSTPAPS